MYRREDRERCTASGIIIIIIIKRISRAPIYHTKWQHRALYNRERCTDGRDVQTVGQREMYR